MNIFDMLYKIVVIPIIGKIIESLR
jgi:hypothetical protein